MDKSVYKCKVCGVGMRCKDRSGSNQFFSPDMSFSIPGQMQAFTLGETAIDPARPVSTDKQREGYHLKEADRHLSNNPDNTTIWLRKEPAKDAVIKITMPDHPAQVKTHQQIVLHFLTNVSKMTDDERLFFSCYLGGGHDWERLGKEGEV